MKLVQYENAMVMKRYFRNIYEKYNRLSLPIKATLWFTICNFLQKAISMVTTPIYTRILSFAEYGVTSTYIAWENVLFMVTSLCLYKALMNLYKRYDHSEKDMILSSVLALGGIVTTLWFFVFLSFRKQLVYFMGIPEILIACLFISFIFNSAIQSWMLHKRYIYEYKKVVATIISMVAVSSIFGIFNVLFIAQTAVSKILPNVCVIVIIGSAVYIRSFRKNSKFYNKEIWAFALSFAVPLLPHYLSEFVLQSSDKLMINYMCDLSDVAVYSVAYSVGSLLSMMTSAIDATFAPFEYEAIRQGKYRQLSDASNYMLIIVATFVLIIMFFRTEIVLIFGGKKYIESSRIIIPICIGLYFNFEFRLFARIQEYYEYRKRVVIPSILAALLNLVLNYYYINLFGYSAAAYTTFFCYAFFCLIHYWFYIDTCKKENKGISLYDIKKIMFISLGVICGGGAVGLLTFNIVIKYSILVFIIVGSFKRRKEIMIFLNKVVHSLDL